MTYSIIELIFSIANAAPTCDDLVDGGLAEHVRHHHDDGLESLSEPIVLQKSMGLDDQNSNNGNSNVRSDQDCRHKSWKQVVSYMTNSRIF